ncbi:hypothetical protein F5883DRAFT_556226 [Diaporthe sp. PMI_573]|nr:hypothetical protein F5883DRAFT_556226 [Diaporthaceae sp. PMI_573]
MANELSVTIIALFITVLGTAIALWECVQHRKRVLAPERYLLSGTSSTMRLNPHDIPPAATNPVSADGGPPYEIQSITHHELYELDTDPGRTTSIRQVEDRYANAV